MSAFVTGVIGVPDKNCNQREVTASTRVVLGIFALCVTVSGSFIALLIKDIYTAAGVSHVFAHAYLSQMLVFLASLQNMTPMMQSMRLPDVE